MLSFESELESKIITKYILFLKLFLPTFVNKCLTQHKFRSKYISFLNLNCILNISITYIPNLHMYVWGMLYYMYYISQVCVVVEDTFCFVIISSIYLDKVVLQSLRLIVVIVILFLFLYFHFLILLLPLNIIFYSYQYSLHQKMYCSYYVLLLQ